MLSAGVKALHNDLTEEEVKRITRVLMGDAEEASKLTGKGRRALTAIKEAGEDALIAASEKAAKTMFRGVMRNGVPVLFFLWDAKEGAAGNNRMEATGLLGVYVKVSEESLLTIGVEGIVSAGVHSLPFVFEGVNPGLTPHKIRANQMGLELPQVAVPSEDGGPKESPPSPTGTSWYDWFWGLFN